VRLRGFGLGSMEESMAAAFIGAAEHTLPSFSRPTGFCRQLEHLLGGGLLVALPLRLPLPHSPGVCKCLVRIEEGGRGDRQLPGEGGRGPPGPRTSRLGQAGPGLHVQTAPDRPEEGGDTRACPRFMVVVVDKPRAERFSSISRRVMEGNDKMRDFSSISACSGYSGWTRV
jgi:hypothetical protein